MLRNDFNFVVDLKKNFFAQRTIQLLLATMERNGTADWEPWWQLEFARFLRRHGDRHEWLREGSGGAMNVRKDDKIADFIIKPGYGNDDRSILLEFKQSDSLEGCIMNMARDLQRVEQATYVTRDRRNFWVVGAHPKENKNTVRKTIEDIAAEFDIRLFDVHTRYILNTGYAFTVF